MSNLIPPLLSSSPPPIVTPLDEDDDDEFGDFRAAASSYDCDDLSLSPSPQKSPEKEIQHNFSKGTLDINCNKSQKVPNSVETPSETVIDEIVNEKNLKDFQDRRKSLENCACDGNSVNSLDSQCIIEPNSLEIIQNDASHANTLNAFEQITFQPEHSDDQTTKTEVVLEDLSDLQSEASNSELSSEEIEVTNVEVPIDKKDQDERGLNSISNDEILFDNYSECVQEKTNSELSEINVTNEIKSEDNNEITDNNDMEDKLDDSSNYNNLSDEEFGVFEDHVNDPVEKASAADGFDLFWSPLPAEQSVEEDDDFGDFESPEFGDFSSQPVETPIFLSTNESNVVDKSATILREMFPVVITTTGDFQFEDEVKGNKVFDELKDVTETKALIYQWSKSSSQKVFFKALNIDTRNILYGPAWNNAMPRFAANLGLTPLEPVKTEILTPTPIQNVSSPSNSSQKNVSDIPTAQFDWSSSGLINPLDSTSSELPGSVPETLALPQNDFLPTSEAKPESYSSLFPTEMLEKNLRETKSPEDENNFELPQQPISQTNDFPGFDSPKLTLLRETHIFNGEFNDALKPGWLQPTLLTPDLPRKETMVDQEEDDEFDDFQMVVPEDNQETKVDKTLLLTDLREFNSAVKESEKTSHNHEHIVGSGPSKSSEVQKSNFNVEDEFTEFHSSVPRSDTLKPMQAVPLEPMKPTVQYPPVTQINWPNPGVIDEGIKNIEMIYSRREPNNDATPNKSAKIKASSKEKSLEEDEWSDFVTVTNPIKSILPERTATPDLPLSVLNLNNVQAPKQPIPVITASGLIQTKLSSTLQPKSIVQTTIQPSVFTPQSSHYQPSIISHQFAANAFPAPSTKANHTQDDDDDWSDFVSSQPPPQVNGYQHKSVTTNIIMNPAHFQNYVPPQKKVSAMQLPDLDFIAPKNRTIKK